jgi:murein DD-endopeptidase MepM/ murein hydrolase activator NlpD
MGKSTRSPRLFTGISWGVTILVVFGLLGFGFWRLYPPSVSVSAAAPQATETRPKNPDVPLPTVSATGVDAQALSRQVWLKTDITSSTSYTVGEYTVQPGDALFSIAKQYKIKPETLLWANQDILQDSPDSLRVGQVLKVPPTDGVYYEVKPGDTLESIAAQFSANVEDVVNWPGNNFDLATLQVKPGEDVMVPGGHRKFVQWIIPTVATGRSGTANIGGSTCAPGPVGSTAFIWPTGNHYLSGNDYWSGHLGIDIAAGLGAPVWAADAGVVTIAQGGWNGGYGNVVMIDHGNGWITVYGHLSQINVSACQGVVAGQGIGLAGSTGNSTGAHLHFETRDNGGFVNPWSVLPAP